MTEIAPEPTPEPASARVGDLAGGSHPGLDETTLRVDRTLASVSEELDFLVHVSPVNDEAAWEEFREADFGVTPHLTYRPLASDPHLLKRRLFGAPVEDVEDPALEEVFREMQEELDLKITMLRDRGTERFRLGSLMVYRGVDDALVELAKQLLYRLSNRQVDEPMEGEVDSHAFAEMAEAELEHYRSERPDFPARVELRDNMLAGLMVSGDCLLVNRNIAVPRNRAEALIHHEVGTHLVTRFNGHCQPLHLLACGLAGYDSLQEGMAVVSEFLVGGLSSGRLRTLAGRVVTVKLLCEDAPFPQAFATLTDHYGFPPHTAFNIVLRVYRGGGFTKDAVYLRGLVEFLNHLGADGRLEPLLVGKVALGHFDLMVDLLEREILEPPALIPRYLTTEGSQDRLQRLRAGMNLLDLVAGEEGRNEP